MQTPYIPAPDGEFDAWFGNFSTLLTANPADFGLLSGDALVVQNSYDDWHPLYLAAVTPGTRTPPAIAAKDAQRLLSDATVRPYAQTISRSAAVTNENKTAIGVNLPNPLRPRIPAPITVPGILLVSAIHFQHTLNYKDTSTPTTKAKPTGVTAMELWRYLGTAPSVDPSLASQYALVTKSPIVVGFSAPDVGKHCTYWGRWTTRSGPGGQAQTGPWSAPLTVIVI